MGAKPRNPTTDELEQARSGLLPDVVGPDLDVLFVGINPSLYSTAVGHHFARPGNRFWPALHRSGFTERQLAPAEDRMLLRQRGGLTNMVARTTARADELSSEEIRLGAEALERKVEELAPRVVAFVGIGAYRIGFGDRKAGVGPQARAVATARAWVLPNPSGLNAHYQLPRLAEIYGELVAAVRD